jgi:2-methylisocitrate lyase-like PEP mutase family enzyme
MVFKEESLGTQFRSLLDGPDLIVAPGCYDVLSALILERAGFPAVFISGYGVAASLLGSPDIGLTSLTETLDVARRVTAQVRVPVILDLDNGYGDVDSALRAIRGAEEAGVAAIQLEDQVLPKRCGHAAGKRVCDIDTYLRKLEAVLQSREDVCVIARTDSPNLDDAIYRARRYHAAGADVTIVDGLSSELDAARVAAEIPGHKQLNLILGGKTPLMTQARAKDLGFKILLYSTPVLYVAVRAMIRAAARLHNTGDLSVLQAESVSFSDFQALLEAQHQRVYPALRPARANGQISVDARPVISSATLHEEIAL